MSNDWPSGFSASGRLLPPEQHEPDHLGMAAQSYANALNAVAPGEATNASFNGGFRLHLNADKFYVQPSYFMARDKEGEVCTPAHFDNVPTYQCKEGQRYTYSCHLLFFNKDMEPAGVIRLHINEPYRYFCNAMPALGVGNKTRDELLVTVQYFGIDSVAAKTVSAVGSGWKRMTMLVRVKKVGGKIVAVQDDTCLHNPNTIDTIPDARKVLARCKSR